MEYGMSRHILKIAVVVGLAGIFAAGGVFAGSALAVYQRQVVLL